jgi:hypothetical protein
VQLSADGADLPQAAACHSLTDFEHTLLPMPNFPRYIWSCLALSQAIDAIKVMAIQKPARSRPSSVSHADPPPRSCPYKPHDQSTPARRSAR